MPDLSILQRFKPFLSVLFLILSVAMLLAESPKYPPEDVGGRGENTDSILKNAGDTLQAEGGIVESIRGDSGMQGVDFTTGFDSTELAQDTATAKADSLLDSVRGTMEAVERPSRLYPGLSPEQDTLARLLLRAFFEFDWNGMEKSGKKMQRLEKKHHLPPLSWLLLTGTSVMRYLHGEYERDHEAIALSREALRFAEKGLALANPERAPDSVRATMLFISGGIKGFVAALDIDRSPVLAALNGLAARKLLAQAVARDTSIQDAYMGLGLFNCMLAKAPLIIRGALALAGSEVSLAEGLDYLRRSARYGCYTNGLARIYLIQYLSPYRGNEAAEKRGIFSELQRSFPGNPWFVFMELEEYLCFDPGAFSSFSLKTRVRRQVARFKTHDFASRRYATLVKWQYLLVDPFPVSGIMPDTSFNLRGFSYYPQFLRALEEKRSNERVKEESRGDRMRRMRYFRVLAMAAIKTIEASKMPANRKSYYLWHIRDALGLEKELRGER